MLSPLDSYAPPNRDPTSLQPHSRPITQLLSSRHTQQPTGESYTNLSYHPVKISGSPSYNAAPPTKLGSHTHLALANDRLSIRSCMKGQTMANSRVGTNGCDLELHHQDQDSRLSYCLHACMLIAYNGRHQWRHSYRTCIKFNSTVWLYELCMYLMRLERPKLASRALKWFIEPLENLW